MSHKSTAYPLRMPADLRAWIEQQARKEERSLNGEIVKMLKMLKENAEEIKGAAH